MMFAMIVMHWYSIRSGLLLGLLGAAMYFAAGCASQNESQPALGREAASSPNITNYTVSGVIKELKADRRTAVIRHAEIPGYMEAMTMPFRVRNTNELAGLRPNDGIEFRLNVTALESWIDQIRKTGVGVGGPEAPAAPSPAARTRIVREVEPLSAGDSVPDYAFTNQLGRLIKISQLRGQAYALTFVFTRCPIPDFCPRMSNHFAEVMRQMAARKPAETNWHLFTLSFDVQHDTPEVLSNYAKRYQADPNRWSFLTGGLGEVDALAEQLGLQFNRDETGVMFTHNLRTIVVDTEGKLRHVFIGNEWTPSQLLDELLAASGL